MNRRSFVRHSIAGGIGLATVNRVAAKETSLEENSPSNAPPAAVELDELTVGELQAGMASGKYIAHSLAKKYLDRIDHLRKTGAHVKFLSLEPLLGRAVQCPTHDIEKSTATERGDRASRVGECESRIRLSTRRHPDHSNGRTRGTSRREPGVID